MLGPVPERFLDVLEIVPHGGRRVRARIERRFGAHLRETNHTQQGATRRKRIDRSPSQREVDARNRISLPSRRRACNNARYK